MSAFRFPNGFLWGAACASHQVEGGNRWNDWWELERSGRLPHASGEACRHFELYAADFDLARALGHNAHRLSLEWSRIEPVKGEWNDAALAHYRRVIDALRDRGIEPVVTLHHFTNPAWFAHRGGWTRADSVDLFKRYVQQVAPGFRDVQIWLTINEPTVYVKRAYLAGAWPPRRKGSWLAGFRALRNLCRAHTAAYAVLHAVRSDVLVGFAHSAPHIQACDPQHLGDRTAAWLRDFVFNRAPFLLLGDTPRRVLDFVALNYYTRQIVRGGGLLGRECRDDHHGVSRRFSALGWEIHPSGLTEVLRRFSRFGLPLLITENGIATTDESERSAYLLSHLQALATALESGADVRGYLYWTLYDNFEWTEGFTAKFGLAALDPDTLERIPRPAARLFRTICETNALTRSAMD